MLKEGALVNIHYAEGSEYDLSWEPFGVEAWCFSRLDIPHALSAPPWVLTLPRTKHRSLVGRWRFRRYGQPGYLQFDWNPHTGLIYTSPVTTERQIGDLVGIQRTLGHIISEDLPRIGPLLIGDIQWAIEQTRRGCPPGKYSKANTREDLIHRYQIYRRKIGRHPTEEELAKYGVNWSRRHLIRKLDQFDMLPYTESEFMSHSCPKCPATLSNRQERAGGTAQSTSQRPDIRPVAGGRGF